MPTGYTAGIVDGTTKDFNEFAKKCMRNFGALMHMRDDAFNKEWEPCKPSDYYKKSILEAKSNLAEIALMSRQQIKDKKISELEKEISRKKEQIKEAEKIKQRLNIFLELAKRFNPPTPEHEGIKAFMIKQLTETIKNDGEYSYITNTLISDEIELLNINPDKIRSDLMESLNKDIAYYTDAYEKELKRCEDSNRWVQDFLTALNNQ